jgi:hypothetical protein
MLTFTRVNHADSANPVDQAKGWITEVDIVTWIMVGQMDDRASWRISTGTPATSSSTTPWP